MINTSLTFDVETHHSSGCVNHKETLQMTEKCKMEVSHTYAKSHAMTDDTMHTYG